MVAAAAQQGVRLRGLSEYYLARPELCRADTVVAGYSALKEERCGEGGAGAGEGVAIMNAPCRGRACPARSLAIAARLTFCIVGSGS